MDTLLLPIAACVVAAWAFVIWRARSRRENAPHDETLRAGSRPAGTDGEVVRRGVSRALYKSGGFYGGGG